MPAAVTTGWSSLVSCSASAGPAAAGALPLGRAAVLSFGPAAAGALPLEAGRAEP
jgi:hypothetical protein